MKIKNKLYISFGIMILISLLIGVIGLVMFEKTSKNINVVKEESSPNALYSLEMRTAVFQVQQWLTDASATGWEDGFEEAENWAKIYHENSRLLQENTKDLELIKLIEETDKSFEEYYKFGQLMARAYIDEGKESGNEYMLDFDGYAADIGEKIEEIKDIEIKNLEFSFATVDKTKNQFKLIILFSILISLIVGSFLSLFITQLITKPIKELDEISKKLAEGDLTVQIDKKIIESKNEIGSLAYNFQKMVDNLKNVIEKTINNANITASAAEELSASSEESTASTEQVSATVQEIAKGGQVLSISANNTKIATDELITSVNAVASSAQTSSKNALEAKDAAFKGGEAAKLAGEKMQSISNVVNSSSVQIQELGTKTEEINKIIEVINNISEQTNLLALNAAIEAARAGEAGKGFAVVADEVRKLAEESQKATKQIEDMVGDIIISTKTSVDAMQKGTVEVEEGSKIVKEALDSLLVIGEKIQGVAGDIEMISAATQEQIASSEKVKKSIQEVSSVAEESAASTEQVSASTQEITESVQQVANSAQTLAKSAEDIKQTINIFKIK